MRAKLLILGIMLTGAPCVWAEPPSAPANAAPAELPANPEVDRVLDALDQRGQTLREFSANVSLSSGDRFVEGVSTRTGQLWFQKKGEDDGRLHLVFDKRIDGKVVRTEKSEYLLDDGWLTERDYRKRAETRRQVLKPGEKMNLLKLGEGPFPLPIGQKKEEVHRQFEVTEVPVTAKDGAELAGTVHLQLVPKAGTRFARRFGAINVWVDRKSDFPVRIDTIAPDESDPHTTLLKDVKLNPQPGLAATDFQLPKIDPQEWSLHTEPYRE